MFFNIIKIIILSYTDEQVFIIIYSLFTNIFILPLPYIYNKLRSLQVYSYEYL